ncbi:MAG: DUF1622 domain-containing protein [Cyanobacteria bacterium P01_H01_bin.15]
MGLMEMLEHSLMNLVTFARLLLETLSVICVLAGILKALKTSLQLSRRRWQPDEFPFTHVRLKFGIWLSLALEFQLGADILSTTIAPTVDALSKLAIVAVIRTFLNYFLSKELESEIEYVEKHPTSDSTPA